MALFFKDKTPNGQELKIELVLGGFYAYRHGDKNFYVLRLVDIDRDRLHYMLFDEAYVKMPAADDIVGKQPVISHVPQPLGAIFDWQDITLLRAASLTSDDLYGYEAYLEAFGRKPEQITKYLAAVVKHSGQPHTFLFSKQGAAVSIKVVR